MLDLLELAGVGLQLAAQLAGGSPYGVRTGVGTGIYLRAMITRCLLAKVLKPGDHWVWLWFLGVVAFGLGGWRAGLGVALSAPVVVGWIAMVAVGLRVPPNRPLRETSALINRLATFIRWLWGAAVFASAGVFGAWVAIDLESVRRSVDDVVRVSWEAIAIVLFAASTFICIISMMGLAVDLWRAGDRRQRTIWSLTRPLMREPRWRSVKLLLDSWLGWLTCGWRPFVSAYFSPLVVVGIWNSAVPFGNPSLALW